MNQTKNQSKNPPRPEIDFKATKKQSDAWRVLTDLVTNEILFGGGAGGGKTTLACAWLIIMAEGYPGTRWLIGRRELKRLRQSILVTLFGLFRKWGFISGVHFKYVAGYESKIVFSNGPDPDRPWEDGSEFVLMDLTAMPSDPNYERLGSLEFTGAFIEEASEVEAKAKEVVFTRIGRYKNDEYGLVPKLLLTCNPHKGYLYLEFYKPWRAGKLPSDKAFVRALVTDNPHISPHYIKSLHKIKDKVLRARLLMGDWEYADDDLALFSYDALTDLFTNTIDESPDKYITADIARFGPDKAVIMVWEGLKVTKIVTYDRSAMPTLETEILVLAQKERVPMSHVLVDEGGIGGGVVDHLGCKGFVSNSPAIESKTPREMREVEYKVNYQNLRSQCYYELADKTNDRLVRIETEGVTEKEQIIEELEQIRSVDVDKDTKLRIISKEDIKGNLGRSPDYADTLMMRMYFEVKPELRKARVIRDNPLA